MAQGIRNACIRMYRMHLKKDSAFLGDFYFKKRTRPY